MGQEKIKIQLWKQRKRYTISSKAIKNESRQQAKRRKISEPGPASVTVRALAFGIGGPWFDSWRRQKILHMILKINLYTSIVKKKF